MTVLQRAEASEIILWSESVNRADVHRSQQGQSLWARQIMFFFYFLLLIDLFIFLEKKKKKQQKTTSLSALVTQLQPHENAGAVHDAVVLKY